MELHSLQIADSGWTKLEAYLLDVERNDQDRDGVLGVTTLEMAQISFDFGQGIFSWER